jgi:dTDP-4-amino-4,6-dideoxygalactose transaminase
MDDIRAAIGIVQLDKIEKDIEKRAEVRKWFIEGLKDCEDIIIPFQDYSEFSSNYIFPIVLKNNDAENRDAIRTKLADSGIQTSVHYPAVHHFSTYNAYYRDLPVTDKLVDSFITLPMYSKLSKEEVSYVCKTLVSLI